MYYVQVHAQDFAQFLEEYNCKHMVSFIYIEWAEAFYLFIRRLVVVAKVANAFKLTTAYVYKIKWRCWIH